MCKHKQLPGASNMNLHGYAFQKHRKVIMPFRVLMISSAMKWKLKTITIMTQREYAFYWFNEHVRFLLGVIQPIECVPFAP